MRQISDESLLISDTAAAAHVEPPTSTVLAPLLIGIRELCVLLSRSRASLARDDAAGRLPSAIWLNGSKRWRYADVVFWCDLGCPPAKEFLARKEAAERRA